MVTVSVLHGICGAATHAFRLYGVVLGPVFHRYSEGYRFAKLACDLVDKHGFVPYRAKTYHSMALAAQWTQPITTMIGFMRATFHTAIETGDLTFACFTMQPSVTGFLMRSDPLNMSYRRKLVRG
jgi:predicted ATPase